MRRLLLGVKKFIMNNNFNSFLGTGWAFPPSFNKDAGTVELVSKERDINQSLEILLSTSLGERVMQPKYGCNLKDYLFEGLSSTTIGLIKERVTQAILFYEPRIIVESIIVSAADEAAIWDGNFVIEIEYIISQTNSRFNYVYYYYVNEAIKEI